MVNVGRSHQQEVLNKAAGGAERFRKLDVFGGVGFGERGDGFGGFARVGMEAERATVGMRRAEAAGAFEELSAVAFELHVICDGRSERSVEAFEDRGAETGMKFFGDGGTADNGAALEDEGFVAGAGEIEGGDERILASADDDDVTRSHK